MILTGDYNQILEFVHSRNRSTIGRRSGHIIDVYKSKGQIIARMWPIDAVFPPSEKMTRAHNSVRREREIEKRLNNEDVVALKLRATTSRFNWWEILGRIHLSREFKYPGRTCGIYFRGIIRDGDYWQISFETDRESYCQCLMVHPNRWRRSGFDWLPITHREAGLENTLRGQEVINPDKTLVENFALSTPVQKVFRCHYSYMPKYSFFMIRSWDRNDHNIKTGESGIYHLTDDKPNWLYMPLDPGSCAPNPHRA